MLCQEAVQPPLVAPQRLHDEKMVQLVPGLGKVHLQVVGASPPAKALVHVEDGEVGWEARSVKFISNSWVTKNHDHTKEKVKKVNHGE